MMTVLSEIDLIARGSSIALLLLWSWLLLRENRDALAARAAVAMAAAIICYVMPPSLRGPFLSMPWLAIDSGSVMAAPLFWLFAHLWFTDARAVGRRNWTILAAFAALTVTHLILIRATGQFSLPLWLLLRSCMIGFGIVGIMIAWRGRDNDLVEPRRRFRSTLIWIIGGFVVWVSLVEIPMVAGEWSLAIRTMTQVAIAVATLIATAALYTFAQPALFAARTGVMPLPTAEASEARSELAVRLAAHMQAERPYRSEGLAIAGLAAQLGEQEYRLRRIINGELGHRNFASFLNGYRLAEVKAALADVSQAEVPIITIALDAGFGSLGPFNRAFREAEGMTPSDYRAAMHKQCALGDSEID